MIKRGILDWRFSYFLFASLLFLFLLNFVHADIKISNSSIEKSYAYSDNLVGWINISLTNVASDSIFSFNGHSINVLDLIRMSIGEAGFNCSSASCGVDYAAADSLGSEKDFSLDYGESNLVGFKITANNFDGIDSMSFLVDSNAVESCTSPLSVDILDDGVMDWVSDSVSSSLCSRLTSCYNSVDTKTDIESSDYCETFSNVNPFPKVNLGARVYGASASGFRLHIFNEDSSFDGSCSVSLPSVSSALDREISCSINQSSAVKSNLTVCLSRLSGSGYSIYYEDIAPVCGYTDVYPHDFAIFLEPVKYGVVSNVVFNSTKISSVDFGEYVTLKYADDCSKGCFIPIKIYSGANNQDIVVKSPSLKYRADGLSTTINNIYSLESVPAKIDMSYSKINLQGSGLVVPSVAGNYKLPFYFNGVELARFNFSVLSLPVITNVFPTEVPAGVPVIFNAQVSNILNGSNSSSYIWAFGDNSSAVLTMVNQVEHTYGSLGSYGLTLNVSNSLGVTSEIFTINVVSPEAVINNTLFRYNTRLNILKTQINTLPVIVQTFVSDKLNISQIDASLQSARVRYNNAQGDVAEYISIITLLYSLRVPNTIEITSRDSGVFIPLLTNVNLQTFATITGEDLIGREDNVRAAISDWSLNNLKVTADLKTYSVIYDKTAETLGTFVSLTIVPNSEQNQVYMVIAEPGEKINGLGDLKSGPESSSIVFDVSSSVQKEFILMDKFKLIDLPIYFSPILSKLETNISIGACNYDGVCDKTFGESSSNCSADCKPFVKSAFFIILALIGVFVLYIIAQEWYKKRYEDYLFKDKNELYNLINFMANAEKQGFKREEILRKLKEKRWDGEKLTYAYKKYKGERTGMIEIPIFRYFEQKKINIELEKRKNQNIKPMGKNFVNIK